MDQHDRPLIPAEVLAVLSSGTVRVVLAPGEGLADGGIPYELPLHLLPAELRLPGTKLWVELDREGNIRSAKLRAAHPEGES